jgi:hypothetical protein
MKEFPPPARYLCLVLPLGLCRWITVLSPKCQSLRLYFMVVLIYYTLYSILYGCTGCTNILYFILYSSLVVLLSSNLNRMSGKKETGTQLIKSNQEQIRSFFSLVSQRDFKCLRSLPRLSQGLWYSGSNTELGTRRLGDCRQEI